MRKLLAILLIPLLTLPLYASTPGDCNGDWSVTISDVVALVEYIFEGVELPRTEWVEVDTTVSVVWILDRAFPVDTWPFRIQNHFYVTSDSMQTDTTIIREVVITDAQFMVSGNQLIRTVESSEKGKR